MPAVFTRAREKLADHIDHWGYLESRDDYRGALTHSDVIVSTARHEFFGIAVAEAVTAGAVPLVPNRLAYPELLNAVGSADRSPYVHDGTADGIADRLEDRSTKAASDGFPDDLWESAAAATRRFIWKQRAPALDQALIHVIDQQRPAR